MGIDYISFVFVGPMFVLEHTFVYGQASRTIALFGPEVQVDWLAVPLSKILRFRAYYS